VSVIAGGGQVLNAFIGGLNQDKKSQCRKPATHGRDI
jgi:hypothetical protein